jgi:hypothetical protein
MGAWGAGSFENDDAGEWVWELADAEDTTILEEAFSRVLETEDYLELPESSVAVAAAEIVAALGGRPADKLPEEATAFVGRIGAPPSAALVRSALNALESVRTRSELQELWDESESGAEWREALEGLERRLR